MLVSFFNYYFMYVRQTIGNYLSFSNLKGIKKKLPLQVLSFQVKRVTILLHIATSA